MESAFGVASEENFEGGLLLDERPAPKKRKRLPSKKLSSRKNFTSDLDTLFEAALNESLDQKIQQQTPDLEAKTKASLHQISGKKPLSGLDTLIRQTANKVYKEDDKKIPVKRVTFVFDRKKLEKLKRIARREKAYLKDLIGDAVSEFIQEYEQKEGGLK